MSRGKFDAAEVVSAMGRFRIMPLSLAPPALLAIVCAAEEASTGAGARVSTLKAVNCGGVPLVADLIARSSCILPVTQGIRGMKLTHYKNLLCSRPPISEPAPLLQAVQGSKN